MLSTKNSLKNVEFWLKNLLKSIKMTPMKFSRIRNDGFFVQNVIYYTAAPGALVFKCFNLTAECFQCLYQVLVSIVVSICACHARDPGSIPGLRDFFAIYLLTSFGQQKRHKKEDSTDRITKRIKILNRKFKNSFYVQ